MNVSFGVGVEVHESVTAAGPSGLEGLSGGRSRDPPRCDVLVLVEVIELEVGVWLKLVGGSVWMLEMFMWEAK